MARGLGDHQLWQAIRLHVDVVADRIKLDRIALAHRHPTVGPQPGHAIDFVIAGQAMDDVVFRHARTLQQRTDLGVRVAQVHRPTPACTQPAHQLPLAGTQQVRRLAAGQHLQVPSSGMGSSNGGVHPPNSPRPPCSRSAPQQADQRGHHHHVAECAAAHDQWWRAHVAFPSACRRWYFSITARAWLAWYSQPLRPSSSAPRSR